MIQTLTWESVDDGAGYPAICRREVQGPTGPHAHEFYEIVYVLEGFCLHVCNGASSLLMAGDILALRPGDVHRYRGRRNVGIVNFLFLPQALGCLMNEVRSLPGMADLFSGDPSMDWFLLRHLSLPDREHVQRAFLEIDRERTEKQTGWMLRSRALLADFMVFFSRIFSARFPARRADSPYTGYITGALAGIEDHYHENLTVKSLADSLGISADHLTRQFRQAMGLTPIEYLRRYRFARALELLRRQMPVQSVCKAVGFRHASHFSREFKVFFDMTPSAFQRQAHDLHT
ncbi:MAG: AraC family transcriptional regulator [Clostridia bacterium]|nr:AraC family transcriptional regulator [Clostridia bacterium]